MEETVDCYGCEMRWAVSFPEISRAMTEMLDWVLWVARRALVDEEILCKCD